MIVKKLKVIRKKQKSTLLNVNKEKETYKSFNYGPLSKSIQTSFKKHADCKTTFVSKTNLKNLLGNPKSKINDGDKSGVYEIKCDNCEGKYIGQTRRKINIRLKEHKYHFKKNNADKSAIAQHAIQSKHSFSGIKLLKEVQKPEFLEAYETLFIKKNEDVLLNNEPGKFQNSPFLRLCS